MSVSLHLCTQGIQCLQAYNMRSLYRILLLFAAVASSFASFVFDLDSGTFDHYLQDKDVMLVDFFAPWCMHCKNLAPELETAANRLATRNQFVFAKVDCIAPQNEALCKKFNIQGYPSLKLFKFGQYSGDYIGGRTTNDLLTYMDSVTETNAQRAPLTANGPPSFATSLGASPQGYINPLQFQPAPHPQAYQVPQPGQAAPSYFSGSLSPAPAPGAAGPSLIHSFYGANQQANQPANQPAVAPFANQPKVEAKAPSFHIGPTTESAAEKFGGNMLALEILRAKLKMIAAYKNWQKRLKEYKEKMVDAAKMNQNKGFVKHVIHKPINPAAVLKAKALLRKNKSNRFQKKYPRTYRAPMYRPKTPYRHYGPAASRRGLIYGRQGYRPQLVAYQRTQPYRQQYSTAYKRYLTFKRQQRQRLQQARRRQQIQLQQQQHQQMQGYQRPYGRSFIAQPPLPSQEVSEALKQEEEQADKASFIQTRPQETAIVVPQPQTQELTAQTQGQETAIVVPQPQTQEQSAQTQDQETATVVPQPQTQEQTAQTQGQETATVVPQPQTQEQTAQTQDRVTNDAPKQEKTQAASSASDKTSMKDLKLDIENAIKDALKSTGNNKVVNGKTVSIVGTKTLDVVGSGSGHDGQASGSGGEQHADHDVSGSGSGSKSVISGSGSGDSANTSKKSDKASGEA